MGEQRKGVRFRWQIETSCQIAPGMTGKLDFL